MDYNIQNLNGSKACELVSLAQGRSVAQVDAPTISTNCREYVSANTFAYYILLNTWGNIVYANSSEEAWVYIWQHIRKRGLFPIIRECSQLADLIISGEAPDWDYVYGYLGCLARFDYRRFSTQLASVLETLRFPKRFSPQKADLLEQESLKEFLEVNKQVKKVQRTEFTSWWIDRVKVRIQDMLRGLDFDPVMGRFSGGTTVETDTRLLSKLRSFAKQRPAYYDSPLYPIGKSARLVPAWCGTTRPASAVNVLAVPKSYKSARIIAQEPVINGFALQAMMKSLRSTMISNGYDWFADTSDQSQSQELCRLGSIDGCYATVDLSNASDRISEALARSVFPQSFFEWCDPFRAIFMRVSGKDHLMHMFATSGSPLTFDVETILFAAIAIEVTDTVSRFSGEELLSPRQYGDDAVIDSRACDLFLHVLRLLGAVPNMSKTFCGSSALGFYRESCGVEYLNGIEMHNVYFPRSPLALDSEGVSAVCSLQHKVYKYWKARMFLSEVVITLEPKMSAHPAGTECADLWDAIDTGIETQFRQSISPYGLRRKHSVLKSVYNPVNLDPRDLEILELWWYTQYLKYGPDYQGPLDELLRVSVSRMQYAQASQMPKLEWRTILE